MTTLVGETYVLKVNNILGCNNDEAILTKLRRRMNNFYRHFLHHLPLPFCDNDGETSIEACVKEHRTYRIHFNKAICLALRQYYHYEPTENELSRIIRQLMCRDRLLWEFSEKWKLYEMFVFPDGDMSFEARYAEMVLVFLSVVDFDSSLVQKMLYEVMGEYKLNNPSYCIMPSTWMQDLRYVDENTRKSQLAGAKDAQICFLERVLSIDMNKPEMHLIKEIEAKFTPPDLNKLPYYRLRYFEQFIGPLFEEIRAQMQQTYGALKAHNRGSEKCVNLRIEKMISDEDISTFRCSKVYLPKLDHSPMMESVLVTSKHYPKVEFRAVLDRFSLEDEKTREFSCQLFVLKSDVIRHQDLFRCKDTLQAYLLVGLTGFSRQHNVCVHPPISDIVDSLIMASSITSWNDVHLPQTGRIMMDSLCHETSLNSMQTEVICKFAHSEKGQFLLQGPPGTGKTTTIIKLIETLLELKPNQRIMVCAPSNAAVQLLASRAFREYGDKYTMALSAVDKGVDASLQPIFASQLASRMKSALKEYIRYCLDFDKGKLTFDALVRNLERCKATILTHREIVRRLSGRTDRQILSRGRKQHVHDSVVKTVHALSELYSKIDALLSDDCVATDAQFAFASELSDALTMCVEVIEDSHECMEVYLLSQSQLIFCTLTTSGRPFLRKHIPAIDTLIIDEAGQAVEPELLIPYTFLPARCLQVGDNQQLPATIVSKHNVKIMYDQSIMSRLMDRCGVQVPRLKVQYRMHAAICKFPSRRYYEGELTPAPHIATRASPLIGTHAHELLLSPCLYIDVPIAGTAAGQGEIKFSTKNKSISNAHEGDVTLMLLRHLLDTIEDHNVTIGVITFYTAQRTYLEEALRNSGKRYRDRQVKISTVDGFQGEERDIILLSCVRTVESGGFLHDHRRINVAITRAKHHLYVLGNKKSWVAEDANTDFKQMIHSWEENSAGLGIQMATEKQLMAAIGSLVK